MSSSGVETKQTFPRNLVRRVASKTSYLDLRVIRDSRSHALYSSAYRIYISMSEPIEIDILYTLEEVLIIEFYCLLVHER